MSNPNSFHIQWDEPCEPHWPNGAWAIYQIDGDQIAERIIRERINPKGYYEGKVIARHSWCGYIGMFEKLSDAIGAIESRRKMQVSLNKRMTTQR